jgi:hypothetical protein
MPYYTLPSPGVPRHAPSLALFSLHSRLNVPPMGKESVLAGSWRVGENDYASLYPSLRPRWTAFLNILQITRLRSSEICAALLKDVKR